MNKRICHDNNKLQINILENKSFVAKNIENLY